MPTLPAGMSFGVHHMPTASVGMAPKRERNEFRSTAANALDVGIGGGIIRRKLLSPSVGTV
jgi:hypothetical protein